MKKIIIKTNPQDLLGKTIQEFLNLLKEKEQNVLYFYFGLAGTKATLDAIGKKYHITRERIRQIRNSAITKVAKNPTKNLKNVFSKIDKFIKESGGFASQKELLKKFTKSEAPENQNRLILILHLNPSLKKAKETPERHIIWFSKDLKLNFITACQNQLRRVLDKIKDPQKVIKIYQEFRQTPYGKAHSAKISANFVQSALLADKKVVMRGGLFGKRSWPHLNPRNTRDKIHFVFKKVRQPLHFRKLTEHIHLHDFEGKKPAPATVHNELIADTRFVLIGRGIYALSEWGYKGGTVLETLKEILSQNQKGLYQEKIIEQVLRVKQISKNTILMNLQTNSCFSRSDNNHWRLIKE